MRSFLAILLFISCLPLAAQTPTYEDLEFESDSLTIPYKPAGKNYVFIRSKKGTGGVNKTPSADAILSAEITDIVLVFSELDPASIADRDDSNHERWENLLKTYPELFQFSTTYKNLCQCNDHGDSAAFKKAQGFYVYVNGEVPKMEELKPAERKAEEKKEAVAEKKIVEKEVVVQKETLSKQAAAPDVTAVKTKEPPPIVNEKAQDTPKKETVAESSPAPDAGSSKTVSSPPAAPATDVAKASPVKKAGVAKARRAKDPKACRPACYGNGDEDLNAFFKDNLKLSKKQRKSAKKQIVIVKLQLNVDGTIKKPLVTCPDEKLNLLVTEAVKGMNPWNATVKSGVTVKSEVKITLKYDKATKSMKPFEVAVTPRQALKCKCASDSELFGSD